MSAAIFPRLFHKIQIVVKNIDCQMNDINQILPFRNKTVKDDEEFRYEV